MKHVDPVMKELWAVKDANAAKFPTVAEYIAHLRKAENRARKTGRVIAPHVAGKTSEAA